MSERIAPEDIYEEEWLNDDQGGEIKAEDGSEQSYCPQQAPLEKNTQNQATKKERSPLTISNYREFQLAIAESRRKKREKEEKNKSIAENIKRIIEDDLPLEEFTQAFGLFPETSEVFLMLDENSLSGYLEDKFSNISEDEFNSLYGLFKYAADFFYPIINLLSKRSAGDELPFKLFRLLIKKEAKEQTPPTGSPNVPGNTSEKINPNFEWLLKISNETEECLKSGQTEDIEVINRISSLMLELCKGPDNSEQKASTESNASVLFNLILDRLFLKFKDDPALFLRWQDALINLSCEFYYTDNAVYEVNYDGKLFFGGGEISHNCPFWRRMDEHEEHRATYVGKEIINRSSAIDKADDFVAKLASEYISRHQRRQEEVIVFDPENLLGRNPERTASRWRPEELESYFEAHPESRPSEGDGFRANQHNWDNFELKPEKDECYFVYVDTPEAEILDKAVGFLGRSRGERSLANIFDLAKKFEYPILARGFAEAFQKKDLGEVSNRLLLLIESDPSESHREFLLSILFRLELGRVGISEKGLEYLGRHFDLGEFNDSSNFAQRITADGKVGIFDAERNLEGFVRLKADDFSKNNGENEIRKDVLEISYEMLFTPKPDETVSERRQRLQILEEFKANYFDTYLGMFSENADIRFNDLSLPEQGWVLHYLQNCSDSEKEKFFQFVGAFGEDAFYAYRSQEFDELTGSLIASLPKRIGHEQTRKLLQEYRTTYRLAAQVAEHVSKMLLFQDNSLEVNLIRENILAAAQGYLINPEFTEEDAGISQLGILNKELSLILTLPGDITGFVKGQRLLDRFLRDNLSEMSNRSDSALLAPDIISKGMEQLYDNPDFNLRDYEGSTTNSALSIEYLYRALSDFGLRAGADDPEHLLIYDVGAGEGRMAIPLAMLGHKVVGIDISERMVGQVKERIEQVRSSLSSGQEPTDNLAGAIQEAFANVGENVRVDGINDRIDISEGNFFEFGQENFTAKFGERQPDAAIIMWHTLGFAGDSQGEIKVLKNIYENLRPGGHIIIEMPDRNFGGYARSIREYHDKHPDQPAGMIVDAPSKNPESPSEENDQISSSRYFPSKEEVIANLERAGFSLLKIDSYFVTSESDSGQRLAIKENLFVASKPLDQERMKKVIKATHQE